MRYRLFGAFDNCAKILDLAKKYIKDNKRLHEVVLLFPNELSLIKEAQELAKNGVLVCIFRDFGHIEKAIPNMKLIYVKKAAQKIIIDKFNKKGAL